LEVTELKQLDKLGKNIACDVELVHRYGLLETMRRKIGKGDWGQLRLASQHAASRILQHYKKHGAPVTLADEPWTQREKDEAMRTPTSLGAERDSGEFLVNQGFPPYNLRHLT
jgi:hypothetical protein